MRSPKAHLLSLITLTCVLGGCVHQPQLLRLEGELEGLRAELRAKSASSPPSARAEQDRRASIPRRSDLREPRFGGGSKDSGLKPWPSDEELALQVPSDSKRK